MTESTRYHGVVDGQMIEVDVRHQLLGRPDVDLWIDGVQIPEFASSSGDAPPDGSYWTGERSEEFTVLVHHPRRDSACGDGSERDADTDDEDRSETEGHRVRERIIVRTRSLGRTGEVDVRSSAVGASTALLPAEGSPSAARDDALRAHPYRRALLRGVMASLKVVLPLLGIGELIDRATQPAQDAAAEAVQPTVTWITQILEPIGRLLSAILDLIGSLFSWVGPLLEFLFGWLRPLLNLLPQWEIGPVMSVLVIIASAWAAYVAGRRRLTRLEAQQQALRTHLHARVAAGVRSVIAVHPPQADASTSAPSASALN